MDELPDRRLRLDALVRLLRLPGLLVVLVALGCWIVAEARSGAVEPDPTAGATWLAGRTAQGIPMTAVVRDGRLIFFDVQLDVRCADWEDRPKMRLRWWPEEGDARFTYDGDRVRGQEGPGPFTRDTGEHGTLTDRFEARIGPSSLVGTLSTDVVVQTAHGEAHCTSGSVRFAVEG
jgi:hypothetical protein